jgi:tetratricopeptide (TPR) repeat protein
MNGSGSPSAFLRALELYRQGRFEQASQMLAAALRQEPENAQLWNLAGSTAKALQQPEAAERCWRSALALSPDYAEARYNLGVLLQERGQTAAAIAEYSAALARPAWHPQALNNLGVSLTKAGQLDAALRHFEEALTLQPGYARAHHNRGRALGALGRFAEAEQALAAAIRHAAPSEQARYYRTLAFLRRFKPNDPLIPDMERLAQDSSLDAGGRMELHFALGKAHDDAGAPARAFPHWLAGNRAKRAQSPYDEAATLGRLERMADWFSAKTLAAHRGGGVASAVPIFIVGMPRSGSTLVEQILASHPAVHGAGECEDFRLLAEVLVQDGPERLTPVALTRLGETYLRQLQARAPRAVRITDKNLHNYQLLGLIHLALPNAVIIHTQRDPIDTCLSCYARLFHGEHPYSYDLAELGRYWRAYDGLMAHWRRVLPPQTLLEVRYENLVADQEGETRRLLAHCGLDWDAACLHFHATERPVFTASATQVREPIYRHSIEKWRAYGVALQPLIEALEIPAGR